MGNPMTWYKVALQEFAYYLNCYKDLTFAKKIVEEKDLNILEERILYEKEKNSEKEFYYRAGMATMATLKAADEGGCDSLNASFGGLSQFESFIGIEEDDEDEQED